MKWFKINSEKALDEFIDILKDGFAEKKHIYAKFECGRTLDQNNGYYHWSEIIERETGTPRREVINNCKYTFGLPILEREYNEYYRKIKWILDQIPSEQQKMNCMEMFKVTSLFKVKEMAEYMEAIRVFFGQQDIILELDRDKKR